MKILICGDKHLKITRFEKSKQFLEWLNTKVKELKPQLVVALGDDMDTHAVLRSELMGEFRKHIDFVMRQGAEMVYLVGNHDYFKPGDTTYHSMQSLKGIHDRFHVVDEHKVLYGMDFVPHIHDYENFPNVKSEICFAHQTFVGADYGYYRPDVGVDADKLKSKIIISGHIHKKQEFGKVFYPGSPYAASLNDIDQTKGIILFDTTTYEKTFIESPFPRWNSIEFDIDNDNTVKRLHDMLSVTLNDQDNWVLRLSGPKVELTAYLSSKKYLKLKKNKSVSTKLSFTDKTKKNIVIKSLSIKSIVDEYIGKTYVGSVDKKEIVDVAMNIINNCS